MPRLRFENRYPPPPHVKGPARINKTLEGHWKWYTINNNKNDDEFTKAELRSILHKIDTQLPSDEKEKPNPPKSEPGKN